MDENQDYTREEIINAGNEIIYNQALAELEESEKKRLGETPLSIGLRAYQRQRELARYDQEPAPVDPRTIDNSKSATLTQSLKDFFEQKGNQ